MPAEVLSAGSERPRLGTTDAPTFITTTTCPYAQRSWIAAEEKGISYTPVLVDLKAKPEWFFDYNPYGRVPTLAWEDGGGSHSLYESLIVNEYIEDAFPGPSLLPAGPLDRAKARLLIDQFGAKFSPAFGRVMFSGGGDPEAAAALDEAVRWLDGALDPKGPFALGENFTLADCALAPFAIRLRLLEPLSGYKAPEDASRVHAWVEACLARPSVQRTMVQEDPDKSYFEQLLEVYRKYVDDRKKAAAVAGKQ